MARKTKAQKEYEALLDKYGAHIRDAFLLAIAEIVNSVVQKEVVNYLRAGNLDGAVEAMRIDRGAYAALEEAMRETYIAGGKSGAELAKPPSGFPGRMVVRFDVRAPAAENWLSQWSSTKITGVHVEGEINQIRQILVEGLSRGQNPNTTALSLIGRKDPITGRRVGGVIGLTQPQKETMSWVRDAFDANNKLGLRRYLGLKRRDRRYDSMVQKAIRDGVKLTTDQKQTIIGNLADSYLKYRGEMIARTETIAALNAGRSESFAQAARQAGVSEDFITGEWSSTGDDDVRHTHEVMDGQKVVGLNTPFESPSGAKLRFPGDTSLGAGADEVAFCRCRVDWEIDYFEGRG